MNVKQMRLDAKLNQTDFWSRVGVTQSGGSRYESGRDMPKPVRMLAADAYGDQDDKDWSASIKGACQVGNWRNGFRIA